MQCGYLVRFRLIFSSVEFQMPCAVCLVFVSCYWMSLSCINLSSRTQYLCLVFVSSCSLSVSSCVNRKHYDVCLQYMSLKTIWTTWFGKKTKQTKQQQKNPEKRKKVSLFETLLEIELIWGNLCKFCLRYPILIRCGFQLSSRWILILTEKKNIALNTYSLLQSCVLTVLSHTLRTTLQVFQHCHCCCEEMECLHIIYNMFTNVCNRKKKKKKKRKTGFTCTSERQHWGKLWVRDSVFFWVSMKVPPKP